MQHKILSTQLIISKTSQKDHLEKTQEVKKMDMTALYDEVSDELHQYIFSFMMEDINDFLRLRKVNHRFKAYIDAHWNKNAILNLLSTDRFAKALHDKVILFDSNTFTITLIDHHLSRIKCMPLNKQLRLLSEVFNHHEETGAGEQKETDKTIKFKQFFKDLYENLSILPAAETRAIDQHIAQKYAALATLWLTQQSKKFKNGQKGATNSTLRHPEEDAVTSKPTDYRAEIARQRATQVRYRNVQEGCTWLALPASVPGIMMIILAMLSDSREGKAWLGVGGSVYLILGIMCCVASGYVGRDVASRRAKENFVAALQQSDPVASTVAPVAKAQHVIEIHEETPDEKQEAKEGTTNDLTEPLLPPSLTKKNG